MFELFERRPPFNTRSVAELSGLIHQNRIQFKRIFEERIKKLILKILKKNPWDRPSCREILVDCDLLDLMKEYKLEGHFEVNQRQMLQRKK